MTRKALFGGLVIDENGRPAETAYVGDEPCYVVDDAGFRRHIPSEQIDRAVLGQIAELMKGSEDLISAQAAKLSASAGNSPKSDSRAESPPSVRSHLQTRSR